MYRQSALAQRFDVFQLPVVLPQLLRHHHLDLQLLTVVLVVARLTFAASLLAELHFLGFLFVLVSTSRTRVRLASTSASLRMLALFLDGV